MKIVTRLLVDRDKATRRLHAFVLFLLGYLFKLFNNAVDMLPRCDCSKLFVVWNLLFSKR